MRYSSPNQPSRDSDYFRFFFHVTCCKASQKNTVYKVLDFSKNLFGVNITQNNSKSENDNVERHQFGWNLESKLYITKHYH